MSTSVLVQSIFNGLTSGGIYILVALGLTLVLSITGIVQLAHGEIYMLGAYVVYFLIASTGLNFFISLVVSALFIGIIGVFLERYFFRPLRGHLERVVIIATGLIILLQNIVLVITGGDPRSYVNPIRGVMHILGVSISWERLTIVLIGLGLLLALFLFIRMTKTGQAMLAISQDRDGAALQGINIGRISAIAMFLGCGLAAVAGALVGAMFSITPTMGSSALMKGIAVIILGGLGSIPGAVVGGLILGFIDGIVPAVSTTHVASLIGFGAIIIVLIFRPKGIWGHD